MEPRPIDAGRNPVHAVLNPNPRPKPFETKHPDPLVRTASWSTLIVRRSDGVNPEVSHRQLRATSSASSDPQRSSRSAMVWLTRTGPPPRAGPRRTRARPSNGARTSRPRIAEPRIELGIRKRQTASAAGMDEREVDAASAIQPASVAGASAFRQILNRLGRRPA